MDISSFRREPSGTSLVFQWLRPCTSNAGVLGLIPGQETLTPHAGTEQQEENPLTAINPGSDRFSLSCWPVLRPLVFLCPHTELITNTS